MLLVILDGKGYANTNDPSNNKPLYTVPSTFVPPKSVQPAPAPVPAPEMMAPPPPTSNPTQNNKLSSMSNDEVDMIVKQIILVQTEALENELKHYRNLSSQVMDNV